MPFFKALLFKCLNFYKLKNINFYDFLNCLILSWVNETRFAESLEEDKILLEIRYGPTSFSLASSFSHPSLFFLYFVSITLLYG
jgi:hypothetical protein